MANFYGPSLEEGERSPGFPSKHARIGYELGSELIGASLWELPPGEETATLLAVSSHGRPDVVVYTDSDKIGVVERLPPGGGLRASFKRGDRVDYFDGEQDGA